MIYLKNFDLLSEIQEHNLNYEEQRKIFNNYYPLGLFTSKEFSHIDFENITIFYGGNGSGKTTLLEIISNKLGALKQSVRDKGSFFDLYVKWCEYELSFQHPLEIKFISSDDIFDYLLDIRSINANVNRRKEMLSKEYLAAKFGNQTSTISDYETVRNSYEAKNKSMSRFVRERLGNNNIIEQSNGESALMFWEKEIKESGIYILDEPENSLSAENQLKLKKFIEDSTRFYNCQFIISTHSPFLLALDNAKIYDLDSFPVISKKWSQLPNIKIYHDFFKEHDQEFQNKELGDEDDEN